jgi:hypothetical protein
LRGSSIDTVCYVKSFALLQANFVRIAGIREP